jgi:CBS domain-containing protein
VKVTDVMTAPARSVLASTTVVSALRTLARYALTSLPVLDDAGLVVGIVSEQDLLQRSIAPARPRGHARAPWVAAALPAVVGEVMTPGPHTVALDQDLAEVAQTFALMGWAALPVVREGRLVGVVSRSDVVRALSRADADVVRDVRLTLLADGRGEIDVEATGGVIVLPLPDDEDEAARLEGLVRSVVGVRQVVGSPHPSDAQG